MTNRGDDLKEDITEIKEKLAAIESLLQRLPEIQAAVSVGLSRAGDGIRNHKSGGGRMNEVYKEKVRELLNEFMKFVEGDEYEKDKEDIDIRIRQNIGAVFMITVLEAIMDDNKEEIKTSGDLKLIMGLSFSEVILSCIREGKE